MQQKNSAVQWEVLTCGGPPLMLTAHAASGLAVCSPCSCRRCFFLRLLWLLLLLLLLPWLLLASRYPHHHAICGVDGGPRCHANLLDRHCQPEREAPQQHSKCHCCLKQGKLVTNALAGAPSKGDEGKVRCHFIGVQRTTSCIRLVACSAINGSARAAERSHHMH